MKTFTNVSKLLVRVSFLCILLAVSFVRLQAQISVTGGTGLAATYTSLSKAGGLFAALTANPSQSGNNIVVTVTGDVSNEDGANYLGAGNWTTLTIKPSGARTLSAAFTGHMLDFNGADNVTIDGLNSGGNSLTIVNTGTGVSSVIRFGADASNNTITNCTLQGSTTTANYGVISFYTGTTTGNDNNIVSNCDIGPAGSNLPINGIASAGTSAAIDNSGNTVTGCTIHDYFIATANSNGISLGGSGNNTWTITNNKFYQAGTRTVTTATIIHYGIFINGGDGYTVSGNTIGYAASNATGTYTLTGTVAYRYIGIYINAGTTTASSIQGNTITATTVSGANANATTSASVTGIFINAGNVNVGTVSGNTIGASSGTKSLLNITTASGGGIVGIYCGSTGTLNLSNNTVGGLMDSCTTAASVVSVYCIYTGVAVSTLTVSNNTLGNTTANNIVAGTLGVTTSASIAGGIFFGTLPSTFTCNNNTIQNISNYGTSTGYTKGIGTTTSSNNTSTVNIYSNTVKNITSYGALVGISTAHTAVAGIQVTFGLNPRIYGNTISEIVYAGSATTHVVSTGIIVAQATTPVIYNNKVFAIRNKGKSTTLTAPSVAAGISVRSSTTSDSIYNNMVSLGNGDTANAIMVGIWGNHGSSPDPSPLYILHNTVNIEGTQNSGAMPSFCVHRGPFTATANTVSYVIKNNVFNNSRTGGTTGHFALGNNYQATGATTGWTSNYNIYNSASASTIGWHAAAAKTFAQWQAAFGDVNSYTAATVSFTNSALGDLHITNGGSANILESQGDAAVNITTDIDGDVRPGPVGSVNGGGIYADLGADEFDGVVVYNCSTPSVNSVNASVTSFSCNGGTTLLTLGSAVSGTGNTYQWQYSSDGSSWSNVGGATGNSYSATIVGTNNYFRCGITCANGGGTIYSTSSVNVTGVTPFAAGTYTINKTLATSGTNFASFDTAFKALACKGVSGPVVFNVVSATGPYTEQVSLSPVAGTSATNTVTINGNGNTLSFNSVTSATRSGIILNGADYITINNLTIDGSAGTYGWGVLLTAGADYNTISNCTINVSTTSTTSTNHYGIVISGSTTSPTTSGTNGSYNTFTGNTISGGYYGIVMYGNSTVALYNQSNTISNNTVKNNYLYSIYCVYQKNAIISGNDISRPTRTTASTTAGVYFSTGGSGNTISKNKIHNMFDVVSANSSIFYGIYCAADGIVGGENLIVNNLIYVSSGTGSGACYGIYNSGAAYMVAYHNTISLGDATSSSALAYGMYQTTAVAGIVYKNNLVSITRGGTGAHRCLYFNTTTSTISSNYNNLYINAGGSDNAIGNFSTTSYTTLGNWKTANSNAYDQNSLNVNPQFVDAANGDFTPNSGVMDNQGTNVNVSTDILGNGRSNTAPDMGAIEYTGAGCDDPPTAGTAITSAAFACTAVSFTLDVTGASTGAGITYQWQISSDDANWSDIGSVQTASSYSTTQSGTNYYRVGLSCSGGAIVYSTSVLVTTPTTLTGTYTINNNAAASSTNFTSFSTAVSYLSCGITGPVTFNVNASSGPYVEQVTIPSISGASAVNTITFNGNGRTLSFNSSSSGARAGITLSGADYVTINNLNINGSAGTYGWGIFLTGQADYNTISNCTISVSTTNSTSGNHYGIAASASATSVTGTGNNANYNTITGCTISGGYYGVIFYGSSTAGAENTTNKITNCTITDAYSYSIYLGYQKYSEANSNNISRPTRASSTTTAGVFVTSGGEGVLVSGNRIHNMFDAFTTSTSTCYCIYVSADGTVSNPIKVINNLAYNIGGNGTVYGIYNTTGNYMAAYHNTFALNDQSATSGTCYGIYQTGAVTSCVLKNNLIDISRSGTGVKHCLHFATTTSVITSDFNGLRITSTGGTDNSVGYYSTAFTTLSSWQSANSNAYDQNSLSTNPLFVDASIGDFTPNSGILDNAGTPLGITTDINGITRSGSNPDIGAIEFDGPTCVDPPTPGTAIASTTFACSGSNFTLNLSGNSTGSSQIYQWQISTDNSNWSDVGSAQNGSSYVASQTSSHYYRAAVSCSGGADVYSTSVYVNTDAQPSGTYTIDQTIPSSSTNFTSIALAAASLACGVSSPVVFNVVAATGPYLEQITIPQVTGASATNTITFNGNGNTILDTLNVSGSRSAITLNGADHIIINNFVIDVSAGTYGWGVLFTAQADSNTVSNCTINTSTTNTTSSNHYPIVISGSTTSPTTTGNNGNYNTISGCTLSGGYYGVVLYGNSATGGENIGNRVMNNTITDAYSYSIYCVYQTLAVFSGNDISRPTRNASTTTAGIYMTTGGAGNLAEKNKIHNMFDALQTNTSTCYAIYVATDGTVGSPTIVTNNVIYNLGGNGPIYGIYNSTGAFMYAYHNTVALNDQDATSGAAYGLYQSGATTVIYKNNIVSISRSGTGTKHCMHFATTTSTITSDYNDLYITSTGGSDNSIGFYSSAFATLTNWKTANSNAYDQHSVNINPQFVSTSTGNFLPNAATLDNLGTNAGVTTDILGNTRSNTTPDIGAYEFSVQGCTNPPTPGSVSVASTTVCSGTSFTLSLTGNSFGQGQTYQWQSSSNNSSWSNIGSLLDSTTSYVTSQTSSKYYRCALTCNSGTTVYTSSVFITTPALVSGTFTINKNVATGGSNFASFAEAVNYMACGISASIVFNVTSGSGPYNEQVTIPAISGVSSTKTITFNGNGNTVSYTSNNSGLRHAFLLSGTDYLTLSNLSIDVSAGTYGYGVILTANAHNNTITGCTINAGRNVSTSNYAGIVISGGSSSLTTGNSGNNNTISNNTVYGGYYGIALDGNTTTPQTGNTITGNTVIDAYIYNIYLLYQNGAIVRSNEVYRTTTRTTYTTGYGVYLSTGVIASLVDKNKIHDLFAGLLTSTSAAYGTYTSADGTAGNENKFTNNLIYNIKNAGAAYGMYNTSGAYAQYYHNTVVLDYATSTSGAAYGFYQTGAVSGIVSKNNIFYVTRAGTGIKRCIYLGTSGTDVTSNYNDLYLTANGSSDANIGEYPSGTTFATLTNWKTANGNAYDQNSLSVDPSFVSAGTGNYRPQTSSLNTLGVNVGVTDDILGTARTGSYTVGAYQNDIAAPTINYTTLGDDCGPAQSSSRTLSGVTITDASGVPTSGGTVPRIYYKRNTGGTWASAAGSLTSGTATNGTWSFTINYAGITGLANGDSIYYYVIAQDVATTPNVGSSPGGVVATSVTSVSTHPAANSFRVITYTPSIIISTATTDVCSGSNVTFNANATNGGSNPVYQWKQNGNNVGSGSSITFLAGTLSNGDVISCTLTANNACQTSATANSNNIQLSVRNSPVVGQIKNQQGVIVTTGTMCTLGGTYRYGDTTYGGTWASSAPSVASIDSLGIVTANSNGSTTISYSKTASNGCISQSSVAVTVAQQAAPNSITGTNTICKGATTQLQTTSTGGAWSSQNVYATVNASGLVTGANAGGAIIRYTITNGSGCSAYSSYNVTVNPIPNVPTISYAAGSANPQIGAGGTVNFCKGKTFTVNGSSSTSGTTGVWSSNNIAVMTVGATTGAVNLVDVGTATLTYTVTTAAGCSNSRSITGTVVTCASRGIAGATAQQLVSENNFTLYPNPAKSIINIQMKTLVGDGQIIVTDIYGKQVKLQSLSMGNNQVNISSLNKGMYFVSIVTNEGKQTQKLVVE